MMGFQDFVTLFKLLSVQVTKCGLVSFNTITRKVSTSANQFTIHSAAQISHRAFYGPHTNAVINTYEKETVNTSLVH